MTITREDCDYCQKPFKDGEMVSTMTMTGSAPELDGVDGERIFLHASCAGYVKRIVKGRNQRERMTLAHKLALAIKGQSCPSPTTTPEASDG